MDCSAFDGRAIKGLGRSDLSGEIFLEHDKKGAYLVSSSSNQWISIYHHSNIQDLIAQKKAANKPHKIFVADLNVNSVSLEQGMKLMKVSQILNI